MVESNRNLPSSGQIFLDHVGWYVPNLDEVGKVFERLGFRLTPYSLHGDRDPLSGRLIPQGSANRLAMLESGYLEFLAITEGAETPVSRHIRSRMEQYVGVHLTAFSVADAEAEADRLGADGFALQPTVNLRRTTEDAVGTETEVAFTVVRAQFDAFPEGRIQTLTHLTPEQVWQHRFIACDNAVSGLAEVVFSVNDPLASAERLAKFTARQAVTTRHGMEISLDRGKLTFVKPDNIWPMLGINDGPDPPATVAVGLFSRDISKSSEYFSGRGIRMADERADRLIIDPCEALGAALLIYPLDTGTHSD